MRKRDTGDLPFLKCTGAVRGAGGGGSLAASSIQEAFKGAHELSAFIQDSNYPKKRKETTFSVCRGGREKGVVVKTI